MSANPGSFDPYSSTMPPDIGAWQMGRKMVLRKGTTPPPCCIKCGGPPEGSPYRRRLSWHEPALSVLILVAIPIYIIVALCVRKKAVVDVCLCAVHRGRRNRRKLIAWLSLPVAVSLFIAAAWLDPTVMVVAVLLGVALLFTSLILGSINSQLIIPNKIDDNLVTLKGVGPGYLSKLPYLDGRDLVPLSAYAIPAAAPAAVPAIEPPVEVQIIPPPLPARPVK